MKWDMRSLMIEFLFIVPVALIIDEPFYVIPFPPTNGGGMEIGCVFVSLFDPLIPWILLPKEFFALLSQIELYLEFLEAESCVFHRNLGLHF